MNKQYVFVYGTLRKHESNHFLLKEASLIAEQAWTNGSLFDTGCGYPAIKESDSKKVYGELYRVEKEQLKMIDQLEDYEENGTNNLYDRKKQMIFYDAGQNEAYIYVITEPNKHMLQNKIESGDWKLYQFELQKKPFLYFAYGSCMDVARFKLANVNHFFQHVIGRGTLNGYKLRFTHRSEDGGRADMVEEGGVVEGKLYKLNPEAIPYLYKREGVNADCYRPAFIDLIHQDKTIQNVLTFLVVNKEKETAPPSHYVEEILRGGKGCLNESYLSSLIEYLKKLDS